MPARKLDVGLFPDMLHFIPTQPRHGAPKSAEAGDQHMLIIRLLLPDVQVVGMKFCHGLLRKPTWKQRRP